MGLNAESGADLVQNEAAAELMKPERVSPLITVLTHASCPVTGEILCSWGGYYGRFGITTNRGWAERRDVATAEQLVEHWDAVMDEVVRSGGSARQLRRRGEGRQQGSVGVVVTATVSGSSPWRSRRDTFLVRANQHSLGGSVSTSMNSLVIRAAEPVIVDTGMVTDRATFFEDVFSLVEPDDVRWIYLTHDDDDHSGNLMEALDRCPNATVVMSWAARGRTCAAFGIPHERVRTVDHGQGLDVGDRTLRAVRPPVYDNAYTRGLFDPTTRVYFAADAFCAPMPAEPVDRVDEMPEQMWAEGFAFFHHNSLCPWITMVDPAKYEAEVAKLAAHRRRGDHQRPRPDDHLRRRSIGRSSCSPACHRLSHSRCPGPVASGSPAPVRRQTERRAAR